MNDKKSTDDLDSIFTLPTEPKSSFELLKWVVFEPLLLDQYSDRLSRKQAVIKLLQVYPLIIFLAGFNYLLITTVIFFLDPHLSFFDNWLLILEEGVLNIPIKLLSYLLIVIPLELIFGLTVGLIFVLLLLSTLVSSLPFLIALVLGLARGSAVGPVFGLFLALTMGGLAWNGLTSMLILMLVLVLFFSLVGKMAGWLDRWMAKGVAVGLLFGLLLGAVFEPLARQDAVVLGLVYYISYFRLFLYPFYTGFKLNFTSSPYHVDAMIYLPLWREKQRFCDLAIETPQLAQRFVHFLREYRPLQIKLADYISHAANAGYWLHSPLAIDNTLIAPTIENSKLKASNEWLKQLASTKEQLIGYHHQTQINLKKNQFLRFLNELEKLKAQTLVENRGWRNYYLQAIEKWQQAGKDTLAQLELKIKTLEPITRNIYVAGEALRPNSNEAVFFGRKDLQERFSRKVLSAQQMPMFLVQGQRRTGKTSLLNFLSPILGSGFKVVYQDLQDVRVISVGTWINDLHQRVSHQLDIPFYPWKEHEGWQESWQLMQNWLADVTKEQPYKLILAFDEYEELHYLLQKNPEQGGRLLGAMRSFSQHQNKVVFLFVGSALFSELKTPNWNEYFVQAQRFRVDYLTQEDSIRLITEPVKLVYPPKVSQHMFELTQGHPALLQELCVEMVEIANSEGRKNMLQTDLDRVVKELVNDRDNSTLSVFWGQFCVQAECKKTVRQILNQQDITHKKQCFRLEEHQFIAKINGQWKIRVPLFEQWLLRFSERDVL